MKNLMIALALLGTTVAGWGADRPPVPTGPSLNGEKKAILKSCKVPEWLIILPPQVEADYKDCVNRFYQPTEMLAATRLKLHVDKKAELVSLKPAEGFFRAYRMEYAIGGKKAALLCNEDLTYCVADKPAFQVKR